jgi:hypothetical protein
MKKSMDTMTATMLLPISFFVYCRKILGNIVSEKEKGMLGYLKMNGMSPTAYNLSFVLHEMLINAPITCVLVDIMIVSRFERSDYKIMQLLCYNLSVSLFVGGITAFALVISMLFNSAGFATQIGSILYLVPIFLSLYLSVLEMKHNFSKTANKIYDDMESEMTFGGNTGIKKPKTQNPFANKH